MCETEGYILQGIFMSKYMHCIMCIEHCLVLLGLYIYIYIFFFNVTHFNASILRIFVHQIHVDIQLCMAFFNPLKFYVNRPSSV